MYMSKIDKYFNQIFSDIFGNNDLSGKCDEIFNTSDFNRMSSDDIFNVSEDDPNYDRTISEFDTDTHSVRREIIKHKNGNVVITKTSMSSKNKESIVDKISKLKEQLDESVKNQDFETSIRLRDEINRLSKSK